MQTFRVVEKKSYLESVSNKWLLEHLNGRWSPPWVFLKHSIQQMMDLLLILLLQLLLLLLLLVGFVIVVVATGAVLTTGTIAVSSSLSCGKPNLS